MKDEEIIIKLSVFFFGSCVLFAPASRALLVIILLRFFFRCRVIVV